MLVFGGEMVTLKDLVAKEMSPEAKEVFIEALKKSCEEQAEFMRKVKEDYGETIKKLEEE